MPSPHLERKAKEVLGQDAGEELATMIDRIDPIRGDIRELGHAVQRDIAELRLSQEKGFADQATALEKSAKEQTRFVVVAWGVLLAAIVGLYGTLIAVVR